MKVIKKGRKQKGWAKEFRCTGNGNGDGGCEAILLVEEGDLFQTSSSALGEIEYYTTFKCSECGVNTDVIVPSSVKIHNSYTDLVNSIPSVCDHPWD